MDSNSVFGLIGLIGTGAGTVVWYMFRGVAARVESNEKELAAFKLHCAETYVTSGALEKAIDRFSESINAVFKKLEQMDEKFDRRLDGKADK